MSGKFALIVGNTEYTDPGLAQLSAPGKDAEDFARVLKDRDIGAFDDVTILLDKSQSEISEAINAFFDQKKSDDLLVLYFSGHGVRDDVGDLYLAVKNTKRVYLESTAVSSEFIRKIMNKSRSNRQVLILDCCNSGAFSQGTKATAGASIGTATAFEGGFGRIILTASDSTQFAFEGDKVIGETDNSLFTHYLVGGLEGPADLDGDGRITVDELYDYTYEKVKNATPKQTPSKFSSKQQGEIVLREKIPLSEIKPVPLPDELATALENPLPYVREAAAKQLEDLLKNKNLGLVRSAREALESLAANDDSRRVAQAATLVLETIRQAEQLALQKAEEERLAREKEEAERKAEEERVTAEAAAREQAAREAVEKEKHEQTTRTEQLRREQVIQIARFKAEQDKLLQEKAELEKRLKYERIARVQAEYLAAERIEKAREERDIAEKTTREQAERKSQQQLYKEKTEHEITDKTEQKKVVSETSDQSNQGTKALGLVTSKPTVQLKVIAGVLLGGMAILLMLSGGFFIFPLIFKTPTPLSAESKNVVDPTITEAPYYTPRPVTVTLWHAYGTNGTAIGSAEKASMLKLVKQANVDLASEGIIINVLQIPFNNIYNKYRLDVAAGGGPDIFVVPNDTLGDDARTGFFADITELATGKLDGINQLAIDGMSLNGHLYGIPESFKVVAFWYNKDLLPVPPVTTNELKLLMESGTPVSISYGCYHHYGFFSAFGGQIFDENWNFIADQSRGVTDAITYLNELYKISKTNGWPTNFEDGLVPFQEGKVVAITNGNWAVGDYKNALGDNLGVAPLPAGPVGPAKPMLGVDGFYFNPNSTNKEAALKVALYLTNAASQTVMMNEAGHVPVRTDVTITDPLIQGLVNAINKGATIRPQVPELNLYWSNFCGTDQVFEAGMDPAEWVKAATEAANR